MSSFDDDMREMRRQVVAEVVFTINSSPKLYKELVGKNGDEVREFVYTQSQLNDHEFGPVFEAELDALNSRDWNTVAESI